MTLDAERQLVGKLDIDNVSHAFGSARVLNDVCLNFSAGEFVTFLGPSGCGKTTMLKIIAGFVQPSEGRVRVDGEDLDGVSPHRRPTNIVFQRPTLFPHLDVFGNVAFGLRLASVSRGELRSRVAEALRMVRLEGYEKRRADELSGGQMQRVALARAIVLRPKVLLLDEPLSALDLKIKLEMEGELRRLHRETGATFVYVTHDQREALALADRVVVMSAGRVEQCGPPSVVYSRPATIFTARFVGNANAMPGEVLGTVGDLAKVRVGTTTLTAPRGGEPQMKDVWLVVRPEALQIAGEGSPPDLVGTVLDSAFRGSGVTYRVRVDGLDEDIRAEIPFTAGSSIYPLGSELGLSWDPTAGLLVPRVDEGSTPNAGAEADIVAAPGPAVAS